MFTAVARTFPFVVALLLSCQSSAGKQPVSQSRTKATFETPQGPVTFDLEVAATERSREIGLMNRKTLAENAGMVFIFPEPSHHTFWMKNTYVPLDMIFIDAQRRVLGCVQAEPLTLTGRSVDGVSKFVVELNLGTAARLGIAAGAVVTFSDLNEHPAE